MGKIKAKILGQDAVEFGRNNPCHLDDLDQDHGQYFFIGYNLSNDRLMMITFKPCRARCSPDNRRYSPPPGPPQHHVRTSKA